MSEIYSRSDSIFRQDYHVPSDVTIVGAGGVGSWVAVGFALLGTDVIVLYDHDLVEPSNLGRTLFKVEHIGMPKVEAVRDLIGERRPNCVVVTNNQRLDDIDKKLMQEMIDGSTTFIDCRDSIEPLSSEYAPQCANGGYDGMSVTLDFNPDLRGTYGSARVRYSDTPSCLIPPMFIAAVILMENVRGDLTRNSTDGLNVCTFNMEDVGKGLLSYFNRDLYEDLGRIDESRRCEGDSNAHDTDEAPEATIYASGLE